MSAEAPKLPALAHAAAAAWMPVCGWKVPAHFGDPEAEYRAARSAVAFLDATFLTVVSASGRDHLEYLNRRLSQRVIELPVGARVRANQLNGEGRMEADLELLRTTEEETLLLAPPGVAGDYLQFVCDKYVFSEQATFVDATEAWAALALVGPKASQALASLGIAVPADAPQSVAACTVEGVAGWLLRSDFLPGAIVVLVPRGEAGKVGAALLAAAGGISLGFLAFDTLRVEAFTPWWGIDLDNRSIPLEADLSAAIHTNKGCYPGQETIAKIMNLGHPARKLVRLEFEGGDPPASGTALLVEGREIGRVTSGTYSPQSSRAVALAMVRWPQREPGTVLDSAAGRARVVASFE